jgi:hypothetical protein
MGYTLRIGELYSYKESGYKFWDAKKVSLDHAPADGSPTDYTNFRLPSYSCWSEFVEDTGLRRLFKELLAEHPGYVLLTEKHQRVINIAYLRRENYKPENQGRIEWLKFWTDWALENCKKPAFVNS